MQSLGTHEKILCWIRDFLNYRIQFVSHNGYISSSVKVKSGVPQGLVIGPASFVTFINDLPDAVSSKIYMFADDTKMFTKLQVMLTNNYCNHTLKISSNGQQNENFRSVPRRVK